MMFTRQMSRPTCLLLLVSFFVINTSALSLSFAQSLSLPNLPAGVTPGGAKPLIKKFKKKVAPLLEELPSPDDPPEQEKRLDRDPRMPVSAFVLDGVVDHPLAGILKEVLEKQLEVFRLARPEGFTIGDLRNIAAELTTIYRLAGFFLARFYIPEQDVLDGQIVIRLVESHLEKIEIEGNQRYSEGRLLWPFSEQINKAIKKERLEKALLTLTEYPGMKFSSILMPGLDTGSTILAIKVEEEKRYDGALWFDNYGTEFTAKYRVQFDFGINNLSDHADRLSGRVGSAFSDGVANNTFFRLGYERPVFSPDHTAGLGLSRNEYRVGEELKELDIRGESLIINTYLRKSFVRQRKRQISGRVGLSFKDSSSTLAGSTFSDDTLTILNLDSNLVVVDTSWSGHTQAGAQFIYGDASSKRVGGSGQSAEGGFSKINLDVTRWQPILSNNPLFRNHFVLLKLAYQYSPDLLTSLEQFSMGGPSSVRAYPVSEALTDQGLFLSLEWIVRATTASKHLFFEDLQFSVFFDYAAGRLNDPFKNDNASPALKGLGTSIQFAPYGDYFTRLDLALPMGGVDPSNGASVQIFFRVGRIF